MVGWVFDDRFNLCPVLFYFVPSAQILECFRVVLQDEESAVLGVLVLLLLLSAEDVEDGPDSVEGGRFEGGYGGSRSKGEGVRGEMKSVFVYGHNGIDWTAFGGVVE